MARARAGSRDDVPRLAPLGLGGLDALRARERRRRRGASSVSLPRSSTTAAVMAAASSAVAFAVSWSVVAAGSLERGGRRR